MSTPISRLYNFVNDKQNSIAIMSAEVDAEFNQLVAALNQTLIIQASAPSSPISGMFWFDTTNKLLKQYRNSEWVSMAPVHIGSSAMATPQTGDLWYSTSTLLLQIYNGSAWTSIGVKNDGTVHPSNNLYNGDFEAWGAGTTVAPEFWTLSGAGASVAQEASTIKLGTYSAKLTRAGTNCQIYQQIHAEKGIAYWKNKKVSLAIWVYATVASRGYIYIDDGITVNTSSVHSGGSGWELLTVQCTIAGTATKLEVGCQIKGGDTSVFYDGAILAEGESLFAFQTKPVINRNQVIKGWVQYNGSSHTINGSYNVTSVTNLGVGNYKVNWTTPFLNANYAVCVTVKVEAGAFYAACVTAVATDGVTIYISNAAGSAADSSIVSVIAIGDNIAT